MHFRFIDVTFDVRLEMQSEVCLQILCRGCERFRLRSIDRKSSGGRKVRGFWYGLHMRGLILYGVHTNKSNKIHVCFLLRTPLIIKTTVLVRESIRIRKNGTSIFSIRQNRDGIFFKRGAGRRPNWDIAFWWNGRKGRIRHRIYETGRTRRGMGLMTRRVEPEINNQNWTTVCETLVINYFIKPTHGTSLDILCNKM